MGIRNCLCFQLDHKSLAFQGVNVHLSGRKIMLTGLVSSNRMWVAFNSIWSEFLATTT